MGLIEGLRSFNLLEESYPAYEDFLLLPFFALFFPSIRFCLDRFVFQVNCFKFIDMTAISWIIYAVVY